MHRHRELCPPLNFLLTLAALLVALCGCATSRPLTLDPIGPASGARHGGAGSGNGYLRVYSATESNNDGGIPYELHTPYAVRTTAGQRVKGVMNHVGGNDQRPMTVPLPEGEYLIYAQSARFGQVKVPVTVVDGQLTSVHLSGGDLPEAAGLPEADLVRLPDGRVAGRRAAVAP